jgi:hypothetical protein
VRILKVKYGSTHAVTHEGDVFKDRQTVTLACAGDLEIAPAKNHPRFDLKDGHGDGIGCPSCREALSLNTAEGE